MTKKTIDVNSSNIPERFVVTVSNAEESKLIQEHAFKNWNAVWVHDGTGELQHTNKQALFFTKREDGRYVITWGYDHQINDGISKPAIRLKVDFGKAIVGITRQVDAVVIDGVEYSIDEVKKALKDQKINPI